MTGGSIFFKRWTYFAAPSAGAAAAEAAAAFLLFLAFLWLFFLALWCLAGLAGAAAGAAAAPSSARNGSVVVKNRPNIMATRNFFIRLPPRGQSPVLAQPAEPAWAPAPTQPITPKSVTLEIKSSIPKNVTTVTIPGFRPIPALDAGPQLG